MERDEKYLEASEVGQSIINEIGSGSERQLSFVESEMDSSALDTCSVTSLEDISIPVPSMPLVKGNEEGYEQVTKLIESHQRV